MQQAGKAMDGIAPHRIASTPHTPHQTVTAVHKPPKTHHRDAPRHAGRHATQRSKTLMRAAVQKPAGNHLTPTQGKSAPLFNTSTNHQAAKQEALQHPLHAARIARAHSIGKNQLVSKFNPQPPTLVKRTAHVPVEPTPPHIAPPIHHVKASLRHTTPAHDKHDPFADALHHATAHQQQHVKSPGAHRRLVHTARRHKRLTAFSGTLAVLIFASFFAYQNIPSFTLKVAAAKAGFQATMPSYLPSGFAIAGPIQYNPGQISIKYKSNSDERSYNVVQRPSNWSSETLLDQVILGNKQPYQTFQEKGRVIYIWDGANATWVDGGVWYQIAGNSSLTSDQLLRIAASL